MNRILMLVAALVAAVAFASATTSAGGQDPAPPTSSPAPVTKPDPPTFWERHGCRKPVSHDRYRRARRQVYQFGVRGVGDYWAGIVRPRDRFGLREMRQCARSAEARRTMRLNTRKRAADWRFHRRIDVATPYGEWAIDPGIVSCESGGVYTKWNYGGSGASGAYQIMSGTWYAYGGGQYASAAAYAPPWAQHLVAGRIWAGGSGRPHWAC